MSPTAPELVIADRPIGPAHPPYIIAELSANHLGQFDRAVKTLEVAASLGVDAVKLQTYRADTITIDSDRPGFRIESGLWSGRTLYDLYKEAHMPWDWHEPLMRRGRELGVAVFSSPFDFTAVELLESLGAPAYKIASFEAVDLPLIAEAARRRKPLILSTGMANLEEIEAAHRTAVASGAAGVSLLHCISGYPTPAGEANLRTIPDLATRFPDVVVGLSDHTMGTAVAVAAVALGAALIEKHFTLSRADGGPDSSFSLEPDELAALVEETRKAWEALGAAHYDLKASEKGNVQFRRSLYIIADVKRGEPLSLENVRSIRPGYGMPPKRLPDVVGRRATRDLSKGEPLSEDMIEAHTSST